KESREAGIVGVSVTNGVAVTQTDGEGCYELPATDDMIVSVIKPAGYAVPLNRENQPLFYYIHKPEGSPESAFPGVAPTGKLPELVNFPLTPQEEPVDFKVLVFGDPQADNITNAQYFEKAIVSEVAGTTDAVFGI